MTMTFPLPAPTEGELVSWIAEHLGDPIRDDDHAVTQLLDAFDFATRGSMARNSRGQIKTALWDTEPWPDTPPFTSNSPIQAAANLLKAFTITRKPATAALALVDLPMPVIVSRHQCPFCRRFTRADPSAVTRHMGSCWLNPGLRCCKTCRHHQDGSYPEDEESCTHPDGPEPGDYSFPVLNCPLWAPKET
ncbi:hypothetical protein [Streptomyces sp. NPDC046862]|uniref:hypothetical protein n=1 Tax=Streptomyces sp. NPDC046862 TaxID=3154603 RepID=UPI0034560443